LIEQGLTSAPTQYRLYGRWFLQVKRPNQQYQVLKEMLQKTNQTTKTTKYTYAQTIIRTKKGYTQNKHNKSLVYTNMG